MNAYYKVNLDLSSQNGNNTLTAENPGIFRLYCEYHESKISVQFIVLSKDASYLSKMIEQTIYTTLFVNR